MRFIFQIQKEFYLLKPGMNFDLLKENWTDMLRKLDGIFGDTEVNIYTYITV